MSAFSFSGLHIPPLAVGCAFKDDGAHGFKRTALMRPFLGTVLQLADYQSFVPLYLLGECFQCITGKEISPVLHAVIIQRPLWYAEFCGGGIGRSLRGNRLCTEMVARSLSQRGQCGSRQYGDCFHSFHIFDVS